MQAGLESGLQRLGYWTPDALDFLVNFGSIPTAENGHTKYTSCYIMLPQHTPMHWNYHVHERACHCHQLVLVQVLAVKKCGMDCGGDAHPSNLKEYSQKDMSSKPGWNRFSCKGWTVWELLDQGHTSFEADLWWVWADTDLRQLAGGNTCRSHTMSLCDARFE